MTFREEALSDFLQLFKERKQTIRSFDGCNHLELWHDINNRNIYFTHSIWDSEAHLDRYRFSDFFKDTWGKTKTLFAEKAQAWSVEVENGN